MSELEELMERKKEDGYLIASGNLTWWQKQVRQIRQSAKLEADSVIRYLASRVDECPTPEKRLECLRIGDEEDCIDCQIIHAYKEVRKNEQIEEVVGV